MAAAQQNHLSRPSQQNYRTPSGLHVITYVGDIKTINDADAIVTGEGNTFEHESLITKALLQVSPLEFAEKRHNLKEKTSHFKSWTVHTTTLEPPSQFRFVFHAIMNSKHGNETWLKRMKKMYKRVFQKCDKYRVKKLVLPLLGSGRANANIQRAVQAVVESIVKIPAEYHLQKIYLVTLDKDIAELMGSQCTYNFSNVSLKRRKSFIGNMFCANSKTSGEDKYAYTKAPRARQPQETGPKGSYSDDRGRRTHNEIVREGGSMGHGDIRQRKPLREDTFVNQEKTGSTSQNTTRDAESIAKPPPEREPRDSHSDDRGQITQQRQHDSRQALTFPRRSTLKEKVNEGGSVRYEQNRQRKPLREDTFISQEKTGYTSQNTMSDTGSSGQGNKTYSDDKQNHDHRTKVNTTGYPLDDDKKYQNPTHTHSHRMQAECLEQGLTAVEDEFRPPGSQRYLAQKERDRSVHKNESQDFHNVKKSTVVTKPEINIVTYNKEGKGQAGSKFTDNRASNQIIQDKEKDKTIEGVDNKAVNMLDLSVSRNCPICISPITDPKWLNKCGHVFCRDCIDNSFKQFKPVCPSCNMVYGVLTGNQPDGNMDVGFSGDHLPGYEGHGTITITYYFPSGIQGDNHPNPGQHYKGTTRRAYLPDCSEGREILKLLKIAWDRKLTFTIGRSTTTGQENVVTWNDIHHKTNMDGGPTRFGYPDRGYLARVKEELADKGVIKEEETDKSVAGREKGEKKKEKIETTF